MEVYQSHSTLVFFFLARYSSDTFRDLWRKRRVFSRVWGSMVYRAI